MALDINALYGSLTDNELAGLSMAREINAAFPITRDGTVYNFLPTGEIETTTPNDLEGRQTGATLGLFSPTGETIVEPYYNESFGETSGSQMLGRALIGASLGAMLGPVGFGLAAPAAAAAGSGLTAYSSTGNVEDALKAAALGGAAAFGVEQLFPTAIQSAANTAVDLAGTGASQAEIVNALVDQGVRAGTAAQIAGDALAGATARQIATDFAGVSIGGTAAGATSLAPNVVEVVGSTVAPSLLATAAPSLVGAAGGLLGTAQAPAQQAPAVVAQTVPVTSSAAPVEVQTVAPSVVGALTQTVPVQATTAQAETQVAAPVAAVTSGLLAPTQTVPVQAATTPAQMQATAPAAVGGLLAPTQTVPVQAATTPEQTMAPEAGAAAGGLLAPTETQVVPVQAQTVQTQETAPAAAGAIAATQTVPVEDRVIRREEAQILTPVVTGAIGSVPIADVNVPRSSTGPVEGTRTIDPLVALGLLGLAGAALSGGGSTGAPVDQAAYDAIARGRSPVYPRGEFTPISIGGLPGGGLDVGIDGSYDYFGPYYGAGRFGARPRAFAFPGLLSPTMVNMATPTAPATTPATTPVAPGFFRPTMPPSAKPAAMVTTPNPNEVFSFVPVPINYGDTGFTLIP